MALRVSLTHDSPAIKGLRDEWIDLHQRSAARGAALSWYWVNVWWTHFNALGELWLLEARENNRLIGIAPLMKRQFQPKYGFAWRQLEFIGTAHRHEHLDFIIEAGREAEVILPFMETLMETRQQWDVLHLAALSETPTIDILKASGMNWQENNLHPYPFISPYLKLPETIDAWMYTVSKNRRKKQRGYYRQLDTDFAGKWSIERVDDPAQLDAVFNRLVELHQAKWEVRDKQGAFYMYGDVRPYFRDLMLCLLEQNLLRLHYLVVDGKIAVVSFGYHYRGRAYDQISGVDDAIVDIPLGHVMTQHCLEQAIANGNNEYSFMQGIEPYKYSFGAQDRTQYAYDLVVNPRVKMQQKALDVLRGMKARLQAPTTNETSTPLAADNEE